MGKKRVNPFFEKEFHDAFKSTVKEMSLETVCSGCGKFNRILIDKNNIKEMKKEINKKGVVCENHHIIGELNELMRRGIIFLKEVTLGKVVFAIDLILLEEGY